MIRMYVMKIVTLSVALLFRPRRIAAAYVPTLSFTFQSQDCAQNTFDAQDGSVRLENFRLKRNRNATKCELGSGLSSNDFVPGPYEFAVKSKFTVPDILSWIRRDNRRGITIDAWVRPLELTTDNQLYPILTIGTQLPRSKRNTMSLCGAENFDFQLLSRDNQLEVYFGTADQAFIPCSRYRLQTMPLHAGKLVHVAVSLQEGHQQVFFNGVPGPSAREHFANDLGHWGAENALQLFTHPLSPRVWKGTIYQFSIRRGIVREPAVREIMSKGLPAAEPYAYPYNVTINEDAEQYGGTHSAEWYSKEAPLGEAERIPLKYGSIEQEVISFLSNANVTPSFRPDRARAYITSIPSIGSLYQENGSLISSPSSTSTKTFVELPIGTARLIYIPPLNMHSSPPNALTSFKYCMSNQEILSATQCTSEEVFITVKAVNDPPFAYSSKTVYIKEGSESSDLPKILLAGTDIDDADFITKIQIIRPPTKGRLRLAVTNFYQGTDINVRHGLEMASGLEIEANERTYVNFVWNRTANDVIVQGNGIRDSFSFRLADRSGTWSKAQSVDVVILSAVEALVKPYEGITEDTRDGQISLYGTDRSGFDRELAMFIESIPSPEHGVLVDVKSNEEILPGSTLSDTILPPYNTSVPVLFVPSNEYCNTWRSRSVAPRLSFEFRAAALRGSSGFSSASDPVMQTIVVSCSLDPILFDTTPEISHTTSLSLRSSKPPSTVPESVFILQNNFAVIDGISISTTDQRLQKASVEVSSKRGYLTFNEDSWALADAHKGRRMFTRAIDFEAFPSDVTKVLEKVVYQSFHTEMDSINITISYGDCGKLHREKGVSRVPTPEANACRVVQTSKRVDVKEELSSGKRSVPWLISGFPWQVVFCLFGYPLIYYALVKTERRIMVRRGTSEDPEQPIY